MNAHIAPYTIMKNRQIRKWTEIIHMYLAYSDVSL